jgi:hypothetical protein
VTDYASHLGDHFLGIKRLAENRLSTRISVWPTLEKKGWHICAKIIDRLLTNKMPN